MPNRLVVPVVAVLSVIALISCNRNKSSETGTVGVTPASGANSANYLPRIGVAVSTGGRTCLAIHNANLAPGSPATVVSPMAPQTSVEAEIGAPTDKPCPVSKEVDTSVSNYDLKISDAGTVPKMTPLIVVAGTSAPFPMGANNLIGADLDQNGKLDTFRVCSSSDGEQLTVWSGNPLTGTLLWHGTYYEPAGSGVAPACTDRETAVP